MSDSQWTPEQLARARAEPYEFNRLLPLVRALGKPDLTLRALLQPTQRKKVKRTERLGKGLPGFDRP